MVDIDLSNTLIVAVQHLCSTSYSLFKIFFELGLPPENLLVLGKCYSTDLDIVQALRRDGSVVLDESLQFNSHRAYDDQFEEGIGNLLNYTIQNYELMSFDKVIILDDGGHLLEKFRNLPFALSNLCGIEQTSSGYNRTCNLKFNFPIVNLARSWAKLTYEPSIITSRLPNIIDLYVKNHVFEGSNALVIGYGHLGKALCSVLKETFSVCVFDIKKNCDTVGYSEYLNLLASSNFIIGCTGNTSLPVSLHEKINPKAILASFSSSDRELDACYLRRDMPKYSDCHKDLVVGEGLLLNSGFPLNFSCDYLGIDIDDFQLTRALLLIAVCQASTSPIGKTGYVPLLLDSQKKVLKAFMSLNRL